MADPDPAAPPPLLSFTAAAGLVGGLAAFALTLILPAPPGLSGAGWATLGLAVLMAVWWSTEPLPLGVTALAPLIVLPVVDAGGFAQLAAPFANPLVFLFLGGFMLAMAVERWGLHRRFAYRVVAAVGTEPRRLVLGFMLAVAVLSMWISNTAAVVLMLPVAVSVITALEAARGTDAALRNFGQSLLLGLAFAASIGGVGTLIGTPPNAMLAGWLAESQGIDLSFAGWASVGIPLVAVLLPISWWLLTRVTNPVGAEFAASLRASGLLAQLAPTGPAGTAERRVGLIFALAGTGWLARPLLNEIPGLGGLTDPGIALTAAAALFLTPAGEGQRRFLLTWPEAQRLPWNVLLLFGGGLSLAAAMEANGLAEWIGQGLAGFADLPPTAFLMLTAAAVALLTSVASNTATAAALLPIAGSLAVAAGMDVVAVGAVVAMAASCAFLLPVATPPNALVFASGHVTAWGMLRAGLLLNMIAVVLIAVAAQLIGPALGR